jgi:DNA-binding GntR family transcriptional regulator
VSEFSDRPQGPTDGSGSGVSGVLDESVGISRDSLGTQTTRWLRTQILEGALAGGQRVNEVTLAQRLGLSRGPIREAVKQLASEGLLELRPKRGAFVRSFSARELADLYAVRMMLEVLAARLAAEKRTEQQLAALRASVDQAQMELAAGASYPLDRDLHRLVVEAADNPPLAWILGLVNQQIQLGRARSAYERDRARAASSEHVHILRAIEERDGDAAAAAMKVHLENSLHRVSELLGLEC